MNRNISDSFLVICKQNYFDRVTPSNITNRASNGYIKLVEIAKEYFRNDDQDEFMGFLQEAQYLIDLWAAHLLLEYGTDRNKFGSVALRIIKDYANGILAPDVAKEEKEWLRLNLDEYKMYL